MNVLIGMEFSGIERDAFIARGHNAMSCDLLETERPGPHYKGDIRDVIDDHWDLGIFHPECTFLCNSGVKWLYVGGRKVNGRDETRWQSMEAGRRMYMICADAKIKKKAIENPISHSHARLPKPTQIYQPWQFGHGEIKATGLLLFNLPLLVPTNIVDGRVARVHLASPGPNRWKERSRTLQGVADAEADQWGAL